MQSVHYVPATPAHPLIRNFFDETCPEGVPSVMQLPTADINGNPAYMEYGMSTYEVYMCLMKCLLNIRTIKLRFYKKLLSLPHLDSFQEVLQLFFTAI